MKSSGLNGNENKLILTTLSRYFDVKEFSEQFKELNVSRLFVSYKSDMFN